MPGGGCHDTLCSHAQPAARARGECRSARLCAPWPLARGRPRPLDPFQGTVLSLGPHRVFRVGSTLRSDHPVASAVSDRPSFPALPLLFFPFTDCCPRSLALRVSFACSAVSSPKS